MNQRHYSFLDQILGQINRGFNTVFSTPPPQRINPAIDIKEGNLSTEEKEQAGRLMRINHCGEVCAQALYQGQLNSARNPKTRKLLKQAAEEENDHLAWTFERLNELNSHTSYLNFAWYINSFIIGVMAGLAGDRWSLGFVEETEHQVTLHLGQHLEKIAPQDLKTRVILEQMRADEECHGNSATLAGATPLPFVVTEIMRIQAKLMTTVSYWV